MVKKKVSKKREAKPEREERGSKPLKAAEAKKFQKMLADVGSRKRAGFIYIAAVDGNKGEFLSGDGLVFVNKCSIATMLGNLITQLRMNPMEVLAILAQVTVSEAVDRKRE